MMQRRTTLLRAAISDPPSQNFLVKRPSPHLQLTINKAFISSLENFPHHFESPDFVDNPQGEALKYLSRYLPSSEGIDSKNDFRAKPGIGIRKLATRRHGA